MYINFWYPTIFSSELQDAPIKVRILKQDLVVFRDSAGQAHCLSDTCTHRGGSLSQGKINGDCVQCPYHGWEFAGDGCVKRIPSLGPDPKIPARTRIDAYPVEERYGIVFAFLGDLPEEERPPIMDIPTWGKEGWRESFLQYDVAINYERSMENGLDPAHNEFVHPTHGFSGENAEYKVNALRMVNEEDPWGFGFFSKFKSPKAKDSTMAKFKQASDDREAGSGNSGPNHLWTIIRFSETAEFGQYMYEAPVDEEHTRIFLINMRNIMIEPEKDKDINARNWTIIQQDIKVLTELHPVITPPTNTKEFMMPADKVILMYREMLKEWDARGWRLDTALINRNNNEVAYAIPSPARREQKGWVLDELPMMSASDQTADERSASG
jgi:phenylpropionate dioxygenase-like ring-hydroxylating dioxygenase large terminal subunit